MTGGIYTLTTLELQVTSSALIKAQLDEMSKKAPHFFDQTPVVLAFEQLTELHNTINLITIREVLSRFGMLVIAVRGNSDQLKREASACRIAWFPSPKQRKPHKNDNVVMMNQKETSTETSHIAPTPEPSDNKTLYIDQPVRSGRQIYSPGDLVVTSAVSCGAELLAAGSIHIYGPLRGRALAGVNGDQTARIYCRQFEAELISISGRYKIPSTSSTPDSLWGDSVLVTLEAQSLHIGRL